MQEASSGGCRRLVKRTQEAGSEYAGGWFRVCRRLVQSINEAGSEGCRRYHHFIQMNIYIKSCVSAFKVKKNCFIFIRRFLAYF